MPIIPYEELLCKEAMSFSKSWNNNRTAGGGGGSSSSSLNTAASVSVSVRNLKISFACLLRLHHHARWYLKKSRTSLRIHPKKKPQIATIFCVLCKRECYVAHFMCKCCPDPICLFHGKTKNLLPIYYIYIYI